MSEAGGTNHWIGALNRNQFRHFQRVKELQEKIRADESLPELNRVVLGATGSPEELRHYQQMAKKIGETVGQPIATVKSVKNGKVTKVQAGIIAGPVEASLSYADLPCLSEETWFSSARLRVPIAPNMLWNDFRQRERPHEEARFGGEDIMSYDEIAGTNYLDIAHFVPSRPDYVFSIEAAYQQFENRPARDPILIGRTAIVESPYFGQGLDKAMLALTEHIAETRPAPHVAS